MLLLLLLLLMLRLRLLLLLCLARNHHLLRVHLAIERRVGARGAHRAVHLGRHAHVHTEMRRS